jgi:hypothetical protein
MFQSPAARSVCCSRRDSCSRRGSVSAAAAAVSVQRHLFQCSAVSLQSLFPFPFLFLLLLLFKEEKYIEEGEGKRDE